MRQIKLAIFDLEGTLFDPGEEAIEGVYQAIDATAGQFGLDLRYPSQSEVYKLLGEPDYPAIDRLGLGLTPEQAVFLRSKISEVQGGLIAEGMGGLREGAWEALQRLRAMGLRIALASTGSRDYLLSIMDRFDLGELVEFAICMDDIGFGEKPELLIEIISNQGVLASEAAFIADTATDFEAARQAEIVSIACSWGYGEGSELAEADRRVDSFEELVELFQAEPNGS